jgi:hypothetical protein
MVVGGVLSAAVANAGPGKSTHRSNTTGISSGSSGPATPSAGHNDT